MAKRHNHHNSTRELAKRAVFVLLLVIAGVALYSQLPIIPPSPVVEARFAADLGDHYSPAEDLEELDLDAVQHAKRSIDVAMYSFTDRNLAQALLGAAHRGVQVRIYRDRIQFEEEQLAADKAHQHSLSDLFHHQRNVHVKIKNSREHNLMHLKAYLVDRKLLRDGSANWSPSGLLHQDNNTRFTTDAVQVRAFQQTFEAMWERRDNREIQ